MKYQLKNTNCKNMEEWKGEIRSCDPEDGQQRLPEGPGGEHAQEAGRVIEHEGATAKY
jgi:hypothetical protein